MSDRFNVVMIIRCIVLVLVLGMFAGCGSFHVGDITHTHIYDDMSAIDTSDPTTSAFLKILGFTQGLAAENSEPLKGFAWSENFITRLEKEQKNKAKGKGKDEEFDQHF